MTTPAPLPGPLADNPSLDKWVNFSTPNRVTVSTGRVELGQGVLTAMAQIAAEELDVALGRIDLRSGDTVLTPNEGYTAGSQSIQFGGVAMQQACAEVRDILLRQAASELACNVSELGVNDGRILRGGSTTPHDYWSLARKVSLAVNATGIATRKAPAAYGIVGENAARLDLPAKIFGQPTFIHDMTIKGMTHARVVRQPNKSAKLGTINEKAIERAARGAIRFVRHGNFLAILSDDENAVDLAAAAASSHVTWQGVEQINPQQQEASWLLQRPSQDRTLGDPESAALAAGHQRVEATYTRAHLAHASIAPSCGLALYQDGKLSVWTHCQGVFPLRAALARTLKLEPSAIMVHHVQGAGCYGHNGADDAAADAAIIAMQLPGQPIRVRWRREEEFAFEPVSPAMVVQVRAAVDSTGKPADWTVEIWCATHNSRPGSGANLLGAEALPSPPIAPPPSEVPEAAGGGATRNAVPLYDVGGNRIIHHMITEPPVRTSALRGLGAMPNVFAMECFLDELAQRAGQDPVAYRLSLLKDVRGRAVIEQVAKLSGWTPGAPSGTGRGRGIAFSRYKNRAAYAAVVVDLEVDEEIKLNHVWCVCEAGQVINPDGAVNQLEGGIIQSASWVLKEQVRLEGHGISSIDWDSYPVLRFSDIPEIEIELLPSHEPPLGVGEVTAGPTAAAIGNAVSQALGVRIRDLPMTREKIMAALLRD